MLVGAAALAALAALAAPAARRRWLGPVRGWWHDLVGRRPDHDVDEHTLADRVRSALGPLEKALDVPHVHVLVEGHVALLHGDVPSSADAFEIEQAALAVSGIDALESHLHVGLLPGDTRPSEGGRGASSAARRRLMEAARLAGAETDPTGAVAVTLTTLAERLPETSRRHLRAHLPHDVATWFADAPGAGAAHDLTSASIVERVAARSEAVPAGRAAGIVEAVVGCLRDLVPDEARDVGAVLPPELRGYWFGAVDPVLG